MGWESSTEHSGPRLPVNAAPRQVSLPHADRWISAVDVHQRYYSSSSLSNSTWDSSRERTEEEDDSSAVPHSEDPEAPLGELDPVEVRVHHLNVSVGESGGSQHEQVMLQSVDEIVAVLSSRMSATATEPDQEEAAQETELVPEATAAAPEPEKLPCVTGKNTSEFLPWELLSGNPDTRPTFNGLLLALAAEHHRVVSEEKRQWLLSRASSPSKCGGRTRSCRTTPMSPGHPSMTPQTSGGQGGGWSQTKNYTQDLGYLSTASPTEVSTLHRGTTKSKVSLHSKRSGTTPASAKQRRTSLPFFGYSNPDSAPELVGRQNSGSAAHRLSQMIGWEASGEGFKLQQLCLSLGGLQTLDTTSTFVILLNMALYGWLAEQHVRMAAAGTIADEMSPPIQVMTTCFTVWFCFELVVRMWVHGARKFFCSAEWAWNWFDLFVVVTDLSLSMLQLLDIGVGTPLQNMTVVKMLRVLKITRAVRILRLVRLFRDLRMMLFSIVESGSALFWSLVLLFITIYAFAIYFMQVVAFHLEPPGTEAASTALRDVERAEELKKLFGGLARSAHTLYQAVSGGVSWGEVSNVLIEVHPAHGVVFCGYIFFTVFALLNIITGVFVETSINSARNNREEVAQEQLDEAKDLMHDMREMFSKADTDKSGTINAYEFETYLHNTQVRTYLKTLGIEVDRARSLFGLLDLDGSGEISVDEFIFGCLRLKGQAKAIDLASLTAHIKRMSRDVSRYCSWSEKQFKSLLEKQKNLEECLAFLSMDGAMTPGAEAEAEAEAESEEGEEEEEEDEKDGLEEEDEEDPADEERD